MSFLFYDCSSLRKLPDISHWSVRKVTNFRGLYGKCSSTLQIPNLLKWNLSEKNMELIYKELSSSLSSNDTKDFNSIIDTSSNKGSVKYSEDDEISDYEKYYEDKKNLESFYDNFYTD